MPKDTLIRIETDTAFIERTDEGIIIVEKKEGSFIERENAEANCSVHKKLAGNVPTPCLIVMDEMQCTSPEALEYYALPLHEAYRSAEAFVIGTLGVRMIIDHHLKTSGMNYPQKTFENKEEALMWLRKHL